MSKKRENPFAPKWSAGMTDDMLQHFCDLSQFAAASLQDNTVKFRGLDYNTRVMLCMLCECARELMRRQGITPKDFGISTKEANQ